MLLIFPFDELLFKTSLRQLYILTYIPSVSYNFTRNSSQIWTLISNQAKILITFAKIYDTIITKILNPCKLD